MTKFELTESSEYCRKCGAPLGKTRFARRRAWLLTISPELRAYREYELCLACIQKIEAWVEHRAEGRIEVRKQKDAGQSKLDV